MKKFLLLMIVIASASLGGWSFWQEGSGSEASYRRVSVRRGSLEVSASSPGVVQPQNRVEVKPPIAGRLEEALADEGQAVQRGQILGWMSSVERAALLDAARSRGEKELKRWEEFYRPTPILAPISGTIIARNTEPGQTFTAQDSVFSISDRLTIKAQVDETDIAQIRLGQGATITLDAYPDRVMGGRVLEIAFDAKTVNNVTTYSVDVLPDLAPPFMRSGMTANVNFIVDRKENVLIIPSETIRGKEGVLTVLAPGPEEPAPPVEKQIEIGINNGKEVEVKSGLEEGETVLIAELPGDQAKPSNPFSPFGRRRPAPTARSQ